MSSGVPVLSGFVRPSFVTRASYGTFNAWSRRFAGGSHVVVANDPPFLYGPTFTGLRNLSQVDPALRRDGFKP